MTADTLSLVRGTTRAALDLSGGRLASVVVDGLELLVPDGPDQFHWGSFPMAPWAGRLRHGRFVFGGTTVTMPTNSPPHALHGLVTDRSWEPLAVDEHAASLVTHLGLPSSDPWPWPCRIVQSVSLCEHGVDFRLEVHSDTPMPAHVGWHPWFRRELRPHALESARLEIGAGEVYLNDHEGLPSGELGPPPPPPWDYCFVGLAQPPRLRWPHLLELTVESDCDHWVLYDLHPAGICVEPWNGPPNCLNGPRPPTASAGHPLTAAMRWRWRRLDGSVGGSG